MSQLDQAEARIFRAPTLSTTWTILAIATPMVVTFLSATPSIDLAYQVRAGDVMLHTHRLLATDQFTFTVHGQAWLNQQWGAQVILAVVYRATRWTGLALLRGALVGISAALVFFACRARGARARTAAVLTVSGLLVGAQVLPQLRPQELAVALFSFSLWALSTRYRHPARIWLVPLAVIPWANVHGSFPLATLLLAFAWLEDRRDAPEIAKRSLIAAGLSVAASFANPFGVRVWSYLLTVATHPIVRQLIGEWSPPTVRSWTGRAFLVSVFAVVAILARRDTRVSWVVLLQLATFAGLGFIAGRGVVWWGLAAPVVISELVMDGESAPDDDRTPINGAIAAVAVLALVLAIPAQRGSDPVTGAPAWLQFAPENLVVAASAAVSPGTRAFVSEPYASWTEFSAPNLPVAVDPRIEILPASVWEDYLLVSSGREGWQHVLDRWDVGVLILHPGDASGLLSVIGADPGWRPWIEAPDGSVYVRA